MLISVHEYGMCIIMSLNVCFCTALFLRNNSRGRERAVLQVSFDLAWFSL